MTPLRRHFYVHKYTFDLYLFGIHFIYALWEKNNRFILLQSVKYQTKASADSREYTWYEIDLLCPVWSCVDQLTQLSLGDRKEKNRSSLSSNRKYKILPLLCV